MLIIGHFFRVISKEENLDDIIEASFRVVSKYNNNLDKFCKNSITPKFLTLFLKGHNRNNCKERLKEFFKNFNTVLS
jgi:hypothetical protein